MARPWRLSAYRRAGLALASAALAASAAYAQQIWVGGSGFGTPVRWARVGDFDGSFLYCRGFYTSVWGEGGGQGWRTDYPGADNNFSVRLSELTRVQVQFDEQRQPNHVVVGLTDPLLTRCPALFMEDVGTVEFTDTEVQALRAYFLRGGFLWVDDFWGSTAWNTWTHQIGRVLPAGEFPITDIPPTHPLMRVLYDVQEVPQVPHIGFWRSSGGQTSERGYDSQSVHFRGIEDKHGRLMVVMSHNTDIADTWEREGENQDYFDLFSPSGYALGVNIILYAMTH